MITSRVRPNWSPKSPPAAPVTTWEEAQRLSTERCREYVVWRVLDREVDWFVNRDGRSSHCRRVPMGVGVARCFPACGSIRLRRREAMGRG